MLTEGWPHITLRVLGEVVLPFRQRGMPGARQALLGAVVEGESAARDLRVQAMEIIHAEGATAEDHTRAIGMVDRAALLQEGAIGWYLMALWAGPRMPAQDEWDADGKREPADVVFRGADKKEHAGRAFAEQLCDAYGVAFEHLALCVRELSTARAPGAPEPGGEQVAEVVRFFPPTKVSTT